MKGDHKISLFIVILHVDADLMTVSSKKTGPSLGGDAVSISRVFNRWGDDSNFQRFNFLAVNREDRNDG